MYGEGRYGEGRRGGGFRPRGGAGVPPVQVGEELDVRIEAVGEKGDGIARKRGFVLFVPNTREGDEVRVRVTKVLRKVGFAEVVGQPQGAVEGAAPAAEAPPAPPEEEVPPEDTETFGEEEEAPEEEPAEEPEEEIPAEEPEEEPAEELEEEAPEEEPAEEPEEEEKEEL